MEFVNDLRNHFRLRAFDARLVVQFRDDAALPFAVLGAMQAGIDHGKLKVGLDEIGPLLDQLLETAAGFVQLAG